MRVTLKLNLKINTAIGKVVVKRMENSIKVPVEYVIYTTSDWTQFEIVEGGRWQNLIVECIEGEDTLTSESEFNDGVIYLEKADYDESPVVLQVKGSLIIDRPFKKSKIRYRILKGQIQSTVVTVAVNRKKPVSLSNTKSTILEEDNPEFFDCPVSEYFRDLRKEKVFIVHGRDDTQALRLKDHLRLLDVDAITLGDLRDSGKTIYEKLYDAHSDITYAIAILTPDDVGCLKEDIPIIMGEKKTFTKENIDTLLHALASRARQNVLLELGLFIGALGKENVCYLKQKDLEELPSDLHGVLYKEFEKNVKETFGELQKELFSTL
ncbi:MAG: nucleotide-binding protein [Candidatus Bathyarchaeota archaeon]|nr:nucleotide-binding protein [Candidatus Termiticorpusculum sp.]